MTRTTPLLTRRAVVQVAMESSYGTEASVDADDGALVTDPQYEIDPTVLERDIVTDDLSPQAVAMGRKTSRMTFTTELRGNGRHHLADTAQAPIIARLFRACGYALTAMVSPEIKGVYDIDAHVNEVSWAASSGAKATGTLTGSGQPSADDTVTLGATTYTFKASVSSANEVKIGADLEETLTNLKNAINGSGGTAGTDYGTGTTANASATATSDATTVTATAIATGASGNSVATTESSSALSWGGANLSGGGNTHSATDVIAYYLEVTTAGASGTAEITVTSDTSGEGNAAAVVTSGSAFTVGASGLEITPTFTGNLALGQKWVLWALPVGLRLDPVSDDFESITIAMNKDGVLHTMPGSQGTFTITAEAGQYATVDWEFTGIFAAPEDSAIPNANYERTLPAQVELARLRLHDFNAIVNRFTYDQRNELNIRPDVNSVEGYIGTRITGRTPEGGIDPEAEKVATYDFWTALGNASRIPFQMRVGKVQGETIWMFSPSAQYTGLTYADRDGILTYDAGLRFSRYNGNDEIAFVLT